MKKKQVKEYKSKNYIPIDTDTDIEFFQKLNERLNKLKPGLEKVAREAQQAVADAKISVD